MVPTLTATLGVKGRRPVVGTRDGKRLLYVLAVVGPATAAVHANLVDSPKGAKKRTGGSETRRTREAFAAHPRHVGRMYPAGRHPRVVTPIDNAPWPRGKPVDEALRGNPHLGSERPPSHSPQLNPIERFWKILRRRATHNRLFDTPADLRRSIRGSPSYYQTARDRVRTLLDRQSRKRTLSTGS